MMNEKGKHALHAVVVPFPAQGHVNPLMDLAQLMALRGAFITFVNTDWIHKRIVDASEKDKFLFARGDPELEQRGRRIRFLSIPDGLSPDHGRTSDLGELMVAMQKLGSLLEDLLRTADEGSTSFPPISFILTDSVMTCTEQVSTNMKVPRVIFWSICAAASISRCHAHVLHSKGYIPVNLSEAKNPEKLITCLPGNIPPLKQSDLLSYCRAQDPAHTYFMNNLQKHSKWDYVLVNTFEELEGRDAVRALSLNGSPALAIGPLFLPKFLEGRDSGSILWEEEEEEECCLRWLNMQQPGSVIYVSFGSIATKSKQQLEQLALGLEASGQPFLWVLRLGIAEGDATVLPEGFEERTKERALFVTWAPQLKVLAHPSVGLFLTHGGWNSTLESMSMGVPVVGFPYNGDQFLNSRFAKDVWKIGLDFEDVDVDAHKVVTKEEVEDVVRRMMRTREGKLLRESVLKLKECAVRAVLPGGSSFINLNTFIQDMTMKKDLQTKNETM